MGEFPRKADGRRVFSPEFKRETVQRVLNGEKTIAELTRELDISPTVIRNWKRRYESGAATAVRADEDVVPASVLREAQAKIRELERALGRKTMEIEILRAAAEVVKKKSVVAQTTANPKVRVSVIWLPERNPLRNGRERQSYAPHSSSGNPRPHLIPPPKYRNTTLSKVMVHANAATQ